MDNPLSPADIENLRRDVHQALEKFRRLRKMADDKLRVNDPRGVGQIFDAAKQEIAKVRQDLDKMNDTALLDMVIREQVELADSESRFKWIYGDYGYEAWRVDRRPGPVQPERDAGFMSAVERPDNPGLRQDIKLKLAYAVDARSQANRFFSSGDYRRALELYQTAERGLWEAYRSAEAIGDAALLGLVGKEIEMNRNGLEACISWLHARESYQKKRTQEERRRQWEAERAKIVRGNLEALIGNAEAAKADAENLLDQGHLEQGMARYAEALQQIEDGFATARSTNDEQLIGKLEDRRTAWSKSMEEWRAWIGASEEARRAEADAESKRREQAQREAAQARLKTESEQKKRKEEEEQKRRMEEQKRREEEEAARRKRQLDMARNYERACRYSDAIRIYAELNMPDEVRRVRLRDAKELEETRKFEEAAAIYDEMELWDESGRVRRMARGRTAAPLPSGHPSEVPVGAADPAESRALSRPSYKALAGAFSIDEIFLIYRDGRLIQHSSRNLMFGEDGSEVIASMLTAVQDFVSEGLSKNEKAFLGSMEYSGKKILLERKGALILAVVISGAEPDGLREEMVQALGNICSELASPLSEWNGDISQLSHAKKFLVRLGQFRQDDLEALDKRTLESSQGDVKILSEMEFYQGYVRLKIAVKNEGNMLIADTALELYFREDCLRLERTEPAIPVIGRRVIFGNIGPHEKTTVAYYLDPQICTESAVDGVLSYRDVKGTFLTVPLKRRMITVVCPIFSSEENTNTAMLRRMIAEELDQRDTKLFTFSPDIPPEKIYLLSKRAVECHDVRFVREYVQKSPYIGEAWYFGRTKGQNAKVVARIRVMSESHMIEYLVASTSKLVVTGLLAELRNDLERKRQETAAFSPPIMPVIDPVIRERVGEVHSLLDKYAESEVEAADGVAR